MEVRLNFGVEGLPLFLDDALDVTVLEKQATIPLGDPAAALDAALDRPVGGPPLLDLARGATRAAVLVCDGTRPVPNHRIVPGILERLRRGGVAEDRITLVVATGLHRPEEGGTLTGWTPPDWLRVHRHDARCPEDHVDLGITSRGTPVRVDQRVVDADLRVAVGLVEPHFMAGFSGSRKLVAPGCAAEATIRRLHGPGLLDDPLARLGNLDHNPLHEDLLEIVDRVGPLHSLDLVLDHERRALHLSFGEASGSHGAAVAAFRRVGEVAPGTRWPLVVTTGAGHPLDGTWYQTVKAIGAAASVVAPGGTLLVASACSALGSPAYRRAQEALVALGPEGFMARWRAAPESEIDGWQTAMQVRDCRCLDVRIHTPNLSPEDRALTGLPQVDDLAAAVQDLSAPRGRVAVIPEGPYLLLT